MQITAGKSMKHSCKGQRERERESRDGHRHFHSVLRALDASIVVNHRKTLLFVNNYSAHLQGMSFLWNKICILSTELHEGDAFHKHWI